VSIWDKTGFGTIYGYKVIKEYRYSNWIPPNVGEVVVLQKTPQRLDSRTAIDMLRWRVDRLMSGWCRRRKLAHAHFLTLRIKLHSRNLELNTYCIVTLAMLEGTLVTPEASTLSTM
jgi:hypothetical protein